MNKILNLSLRTIALSFTMSLYSVITGSYIHSINTNFMFCVKNNTYGEFWFELMMFFIGGTLLLIFYMMDIKNILKGG